MTTDGACFIPWGFITILCMLSWGDDNWRSMFHTWMIHNHVLTVVMRRWQLTKHESYFSDKLPCSDRCHDTMTTEWACFLPEEYISMLWPLAWDGGNWRSMFHKWMIYYHALTFVIKRWLLNEHDSCLRDILPWHIRCHDAKTTDEACFIHEWYITML